jgi:eukaryotic-like serine/threonine-protein kinase
MEISKIFLFVTQGTFQRRRYVLENSAQCLVGRAADCDIRLSPGQGAGEISGHHCLIELTPTSVTVRDLRSRTGTYVNGEKVSTSSSPDGSECHPSADLGRVLEAGDLIRVGHTLIRVAICMTDNAAEESAYSQSVLWL